MSHPRKTIKHKYFEGYGTGHGAEYKPFLRAREYGSLGTTSHLPNPYIGRVMELFSQGELEFAYILLWDPSVTDIREQYPLPIEDALAVARLLKYRYPHNKETPMTSDFLVDYQDHHQEVFSVKYSRESVLGHRRALEKLAIEKMYWECVGVKWSLIFRTELNHDYVTNIRLCLEYWNPADVHSEASYVKCLIAHRKIIADMESMKIDFNSLGKQYKKEYEKWKTKI